jgi:hypothetical protein
MDGKAKPATRRDVDLVKAQTEFAAVTATAERNRTIGQGVRGAMIIVACTAPIWAMQGLVEPLAGRTTVVKASIVLSASFTVSLVGNGFQILKGRTQRRTIRRLRARITDLERRLSLGNS